MTAVFDILFGETFGMVNARKKTQQGAAEREYVRDEIGRFGEGTGDKAPERQPEKRPVFAGSVVAPVVKLAEGKKGYNAEHGLDAPTDRDWADVTADPALGTQIAGDYDAMSDYNAEAEPAYDALSSEVDAQYAYLTETLGVTVTFGDTDPYDNVEQLTAISRRTTISVCSRRRRHRPATRTCRTR